MASILRLVRSTKIPSLQQRSVATRAPTILSADAVVEEQTLPGYRPEDYYPVQLGEIFSGRYVVISKLGYGVSSTVWLARDTKA